MIATLASRLLERRVEVEDWFSRQWEGLTPPLYASVDLRDGGFKLAAVDTNAFPAGFNNLGPDFRREAVEAFRDHFARHLPRVRRVLLLPEAFARNRLYLENVRLLSSALREAGLEVEVGWPFPGEPPARLEASGGFFTMRPLAFSGGRLRAGGFEPDLILSNNDFSNGLPPTLIGVDVPILPPPSLGWDHRRKHHHFLLLEKSLAEFARLIGVDLFQIGLRSALSRHIDLNDPGARGRLAEETAWMLAAIRADYAARGIRAKSFLFIKDNSGTFGLAQMTAASPDDVLSANHRARGNMKRGKGGRQVREFLLQEGIPTVEHVGPAPMEPVVYLIGGRPVGGFYRYHAGRGERESLNSPGASFARLCWTEAAARGGTSSGSDCPDPADLLLACGVIGRIACLALARETVELADELAAKTEAGGQETAYPEG